MKTWGLFLTIGIVIIWFFITREIELNSDKKLIQKCTEEEYCHGRIESLERLVKAQKSLKSYNLSNANLEGANLEGANFESANLGGAYLFRANLKSTNLNSANLNSANLWYANLGGANLKSTNLKSTNLWYANLGGANLNSANLKNANLNRANLKSTNLKSTNLEDANLGGANLNRANLNRANLIKVKDLTPSQIKSACNWESAFYKGHYDLEKRKWIFDEPGNQRYIEQLKQDKASNQKNKVDCIRWKE